MRDQATDLARDWITLFLTGLGISFAPHEYLGGLFLALASASLARRLSPEVSRVGIWAMLTTGFLVSHLAAMLATIFVPDWPVQLFMAASGFSSKWIAQFGLRILDRLSLRGDQLADRVIDRVLPDKSDKEDKR